MASAMYLAGSSPSSRSSPSVPDIAVDVEDGFKTAIKVSNSEQQFQRSNSRMGLRIAFKDLSYIVKSSTEKGVEAHLLKSVSGFFEPNQMAALMGPSGSGKTTLLDLLAGRKTVGRSEGTLVFGGAKPTPAFLRRYTGYVEQFDTLLGDLSVEEMLMYTAELKRSIQEPLSSKREEVDKLLKKLGLDVCRKVLIGDPMSKGISGGQAKRTNIAIALITNPRVLFLDEPTSGLDSFTANEVMKAVKHLTADGTTICATIHSPTATTFALFDRVLLLVRGQVVYFGAQGATAIEYASQAWPGSPSPALLGHSNDAEWLVEVVTEADQNKQGHILAEAYSSSQLKKDNDKLLDSFLTAKADISEEVQKELATKKDTATPSWWALKTLLKYRSSRNFRNPGWLGPRIGDKLLISLIILTLYLGIGDNFKESNLINIQSALFMWALLPAFGAASYVPAIVLERRLFTRERSDGLYRVITYLMAKIVEEVALALIITLAFSAYVFYGLQLKGAWVIFWLVYFIDLCVGIVLAYFIAAMSPNMDVANAALPGFVVTLLFFAGQLITVDSIPNYWQWYSRIDFLRYAWGALMVNQFKDNDVEFSADVSILTYYSLKHEDKWAYVGYLSIFFFVFGFFAFLALTFIKHQKR